MTEKKSIKNSKLYKIYDNIFIADLSLYLAKESVLIISDLQLGYEEALNKKGYLIPRFQKRDILNRLETLLKFLKPKKVIINGDIKHEFSVISKSEWKSVKEIIDFIKEKAELILIKGNHDNMLEPIAKNKGLELKDFYFVDNIYICHGHEIHKNEFIEKAKLIIIGHEHPAIGLRESGRVEKFKCFLKGTFKYESKKRSKEKNIKHLIVLPSFNTLTEGTDILSEKIISPYIKDIDDFEIYLVNDYDNDISKGITSIPEILYFGKVKDHFN